MSWPVTREAACSRCATSLNVERKTWKLLLKASVLFSVKCHVGMVMGVLGKRPRACVAEAGHSRKTQPLRFPVTHRGLL